jgi:hypothetical protein
VPSFQHPIALTSIVSDLIVKMAVLRNYALSERAGLTNVIHRTFTDWITETNTGFSNQDVYTGCCGYAVILASPKIRNLRRLSFEAYIAQK